MERAYFLDAAVIVIRLILLCSPDANNPHHLQHNHRRSQKDKQVKLPVLLLSAALQLLGDGGNRVVG